MAHDPERLGRFHREAKALAQLDHPNIVTIHSVEECDGVHFLTMQLVVGQSLDRVIPVAGLPLDRIVEIAAALGDALAAAHDKGIVHRDLKPANVMVTSEGRVKVLDFGFRDLARQLSQKSALAATSTSPSRAVPAADSSAARTDEGSLLLSGYFSGDRRTHGSPPLRRTCGVDRMLGSGLSDGPHSLRPSLSRSG